MNFNRVFLGGHLTRHPQLKYLPSQTAVVEFGIATNRKWRDKDGQDKEEVCFVDCKMFGKRAEVVDKYFKKGDTIFIEGRLQFDSWQSQDGTKRNKLSVVVENFEFVGGQKNQESAGQQQKPVEDLPF